MSTYLSRRIIEEKIISVYQLLDIVIQWAHYQVLERYEIHPSIKLFLYLFSATNRKYALQFCGLLASSFFFMSYPFDFKSILILVELQVRKKMFSGFRFFTKVFYFLSSSFFFRIYRHRRYMEVLFQILVFRLYSLLFLMLNEIAWRIKK